MQSNKVQYTVIEKKKPKKRETANDIYVPVGNSLVKEAWENTKSMIFSLKGAFSSLKPKRTADSLAILVITMLLMSTPSLGFVMAKDTEQRTGEKVAGIIGEVASETYPVINAKLKDTLDNIKLKVAPIVKGMVEKAAVEKLEKENITVKEVKHQKMTYKELIEKSDEAFFGEVESQSQDLEGVTLTIAEADMEDPLTAEMVAFGGRLAWPVPGYERLSSHFGHRRSPGGIGSTNHQGIDIPAPTGTPIIAVKDGTVKSAGRYGGYGNCVVIDHGNEYETLYGHMSVITCNAGDKVKPGDVIGKVGSTGNSTGPHLHFGILKNGTYVDPEPYLTGRELVKPGDEVSENAGSADTPQTAPTENSSNPKEEKTKPTSKPEQTTAPSTEQPKPETPATTQAPTQTEPTEPPAQPTTPEPESKPEPQPTTQPPAQTSEPK